MVFCSEEEINILMIANSFGVNINHYVHQIAEKLGKKINIGILYIPGCSLKTHCDNLSGSKKVYEYFENGISTKEQISILDGIKRRKWNYISLQQFSGESGIYDSYFPYIDQLIKYVNDNCSDFDFLLHETWAYKSTTSHPWFQKYNKNAAEMALFINNVYINLHQKYGFKIIKSGEVIQYLVDKTDYDFYQEDGFHLNDLGEYAVGLNLVHMLLNISNFSNLYIPTELEDDKCRDIEKLLNENKLYL